MRRVVLLTGVLLLNIGCVTRGRLRSFDKYFTVPVRIFVDEAYRKKYPDWRIRIRGYYTFAEINFHHNDIPIIFDIRSIEALTEQQVDINDFKYLNELGKRLESTKGGGYEITSIFTVYVGYSRNGTAFKPLNEGESYRTDILRIYADLLFHVIAQENDQKECGGDCDRYTIHTIMHELGHNFRVHHFTDKNYIMDSYTKTSLFKFSKINRITILKTLRKRYKASP